MSSARVAIPALRIQLRELGNWVWVHLLNRLAFGLFFVVVHYYLSTFMRVELVEIRGHVLGSYFLLAMLPAFTFTDTTQGMYFGMGFTRPIPTLQLVIVPLLLSVIVALVSFLVPVSLMFWLMGASVPLAKPTILLVCSMCCLYASSSTAATVAGRWTGTTLTFAVLSIFYTIGFATARNSQQGAFAFWAFPSFIYVGATVLGAIAIVISILGVQRRRHGDSIWSFVKIPAIGWYGFSAYGAESQLGNPVASTRLTHASFRNPWRSQCWHEFRNTKRLLTLSIVLVPVAVVTFVGMCNYFDPSPKDAFYCLAASLFICPLVYQLLAISSAQVSSAAKQGLRNQNMACPLHVFEATRPLRSDHFIAIKLLFVAGWSLIGWLVQAVATLIYVRFVGNREAVLQVGESLLSPIGEASGYWWIVAAVAGTLFYISTASMWLAFQYWVHITLRIRVFVSLLALGAISLLLVVVDMSSDWSLGVLWRPCSYLCTTGVAVLCAIALKHSLGNRLLSKPYLSATIALWAVFVCAAVALAVRLSPAIPTATPWIVYFVGGVALWVPLAAATSAPLGLAEHRHG